MNRMMFVDNNVLLVVSVRIIIISIQNKISINPYNVNKNRNVHVTMSKRKNIIDQVPLSNVVNVRLGKLQLSFIISILLSFSFSICLNGRFQCNSDKCNQTSVICPNNFIFTETSLSTCPKTCSNHLIWKNCYKYRSGCDCPTNMIRDEHTNRCVYPKHCSCQFRKKIFPYGSKITQDCNEW